MKMEKAKGVKNENFKYCTKCLIFDKKNLYYIQNNLCLFCKCKALSFKNFT